MENESSLEVGDNQASAVQVTPNRVTLESMEGKIESYQVLHPEFAPHMTIYIAQLTNGYVLVGKSAPADPENFDPALGVKFAREDAIRQMWPLEGYALRERLSAA